MKKQFLLFLFVVTTGLANGQVSVANDYFNYLYVGIENPISISATSIPDYNMTIAVNKGKLKKTGAGKFTWTVCTQEMNSVVLKIYDKLMLIDSFVFKLKALPDPKIMLHTQDNEIMFKGTTGVRAEIENISVEGISVVTNKFLVTIIKKTGAEIKLENSGSEYTAAVAKAFKTLVAGDRVILSDFNVTVGCESTQRKLTTVIDQVYSGKQLEFRY